MIGAIKNKKILASGVIVATAFFLFYAPIKIWLNTKASNEALSGARTEAELLQTTKKSLLTKLEIQKQKKAAVAHLIYETTKAQADLENFSKIVEQVGVAKIEGLSVAPNKKWFNAVDASFGVTPLNNYNREAVGNFVEFYLDQMFELHSCEQQDGRFHIILKERKNASR